MKAPKLVYVAGPYRGLTTWATEQNIREAEAVAYRVAGLGAYPVCPHTNTRGHFESIPVVPTFWLEATLELMRRCDGAVFTVRWMESSGARADHLEAEPLGLPIFGEAHLVSGQFSEWLRGAPPP